MGRLCFALTVWAVPGRLRGDSKVTRAALLCLIYARGDTGATPRRRCDQRPRSAESGQLRRLAGQPEDGVPTGGGNKY